MPKRTELRVDHNIHLLNPNSLGISPVKNHLLEDDVRRLAVKNGADPLTLTIINEPLATSNQTAFFKKRFTSICLGAKFLLRHLSEDIPPRHLRKESASSDTPKQLTTIEQQTLINFIAQLTLKYEKVISNPALTLEQLGDTLHEYGCLLTSGFASTLNQSQAFATHWLSKAEEYYLLTEPRVELMTLKTLKANDKRHYTLQVESPLSALSDSLLHEYWLVKQSSASEPEWYTCLAPMEQRFLCEILEPTSSKEDIAALFANFTSRLRSIPGMANFRKHTVMLLDSNLTPLLQDERYASSMVSSRDLQKGLNTQDVRDHHTKSNITHIIDVALPGLIENKLSGQCHLEGEDVTLDLQMALQSLISPILPTSAQPDAKLYADKQRTAKTFSYHKELPFVSTNAKGEQTTINLSVNMHLLPTNHPLNDANKLDYTAPNNVECQNFIRNVRAFLDKNPTHKNARDITFLLNQYHTLLQTGSLMHANWHDANKRELYLSSLEQLLTRLQGNLSYGSCVSGKDRKALELMHTDAMLIYHCLYSRWPNYSDTANSDRLLFIQIFSSLYLSHHHHFSAELNAPGSKGIKNPFDYLPYDIIQSLTRHYERLSLSECLTSTLRLDDALASINELRSSTKNVLGFCDESYALQASSEMWFIKLELAAHAKIEAAAQLETETQPQSVETSILNITRQTYIKGIWRLIKHLILSETHESKEYWDKNTSYKLNFSSLLKAAGLFQHKKSRPKGIKQITTTINQAGDGVISDESLVELSSIVKEQLKKNPGISLLGIPFFASRYPDTQNFYTLLDKLLDNMITDEESISSQKALVAIYDGMSQLYNKANKYSAPAITDIAENSDTEEEASDTEEKTATLNDTSACAI